MFALRAVRGPSPSPPSSLGTRRGGHSARLCQTPMPATIWHRFRDGAPQRRQRVDVAHLARARRASASSTARRSSSTRPTTSAPGSQTPLRAGCCSACAETVLGPGARVEIAAPEHDERRAARARGRSGRALAQELNPRLTFDQFVIGDCNRLAHAAALAVAEMPGLAYNPLFICGPPGLGKTHLLHSIANYVDEHGGGLTVRYTTVEAFTDHFVGALHGGGIEAFKAAYRGVDVLLVDDVQFLAEQGEDRAGVLPHLQRAAPGRRAARADLRPPAARHGRARGPPARALRGRPGVRRPPARPRHAPDDPAQARRARTTSATSSPTALELIADRVDDEHPRARGRADPRRRVRLAHRPRRHRRARRARSSPASIPSSRPRRAPSREIQERDLRGLRRLDRRAALREPRPAASPRPPGRDVPLARADRRDAAGDRPRLRRPQPHDRPARLQAHRRADRRPTPRPTTLSGGSPETLGGRVMRSDAPDRLRQFIHSACTRPRSAADIARLVHTMNSPDDH